MLESKKAPLSSVTILSPDLLSEVEAKMLPFHAASIILSQLNHYYHNFKALTKRAQLRFECRDWQGMMNDHRKQSEYYRDAVGDAKIRLQKLLGAQLKNRPFWHNIKAQYEDLTLNLYYKDVAETFFNSTYRHVHKGLSVDKELMYVLPSHNQLTYYSARPILRTYHGRRAKSTRALVAQFMKDYKLNAPYEDFERDIDLITNKIQNELLTRYTLESTSRLEILIPIFFRSKNAYIVGRAHLGGIIHPFVVSLRHNKNGVYTDALLLDANFISSTFSYYRSSFLVDSDIPGELVEFLLTIMPHKKLSELYSSLGFEKHGKTEFYREFLEHLDDHAQEVFSMAPGIRGMVMSVFTLPSHDSVFKIIKDNYALQKSISNKHVTEKYALVSKHDRVGRMADTHLFENFVVEKSRFSPETLKELKKVAKSKVIIRGDKVEIKQLYTEKKMIPLNIYLETADDTAARHALDEYGRAIKELAAINIFPGDLLLKNFGVTRLKRVVFYDYDEIELVTDCNFRSLPESRDHEMSEGWFFVGEKDVFPQEFPPFLFPNEKLKKMFMELHPEIFTSKFWCEVQNKLKQGAIPDVFSYPHHQRFGYGGWRTP